MEKGKVFLIINKIFRKLYALDVFGFAATYLIVLSNPVREASSVNVTHTATTFGAILLAAYLSYPGRRARNAVFSFLLIFLFASQVLTAACMLLFDRYSNMWRNLMTVHVVGGLEIFGPFFMMYYFHHIYEKRFAKDETGELFAHVGFSVFRVGLWTGIIAGFATGSMTMIPLHKWAMLLAAPLVLFHAALGTKHMLRFLSKRQTLLPRFYASLFLSLILFLCVVFALYHEPKPVLLSQNEFIARSDPSPVRTGFSFKESLVRTPQNAVFHAGTIGDSQKSCGEFGCHKVMYEEWLESPHRRSTNIFYEKSLQLAIKKGGLKAAKLCAGCHDPISLLSGDMTGKKPVSDVSRNEGISCLVCHSISPHKNIMQNGSYTFTMPSRFFAFVQNIYTVHDLKDEHLGDFLKKEIKMPEYCGMCHRSVLSKKLTGASQDIVDQDPYTSWKEGPYHNPRHPKFKQSEKQNCNDCHMPRTTQQERPVPLSPSHRFAASNSALPFINGDTKQLKAVEKFLKTKVLRLKIKKQGRVYFSVTVENTGAGHHFPAGPLDINEVWLEIIVQDEKGNVIYHSGFIDKNSHVDKNARFFKILETDKNGNEIKGHDILNVMSKKTIRIIPPKGKITETYALPEEKAQGSLTATARVNYRKFNQEFTDWVLGKGKMKLPVVEMAKAVKKLAL